MGAFRTTLTNGPAPRLLRVLAGLIRGIRQSLADSYRPERHYMRGPGPKSRQRHHGLGGV